jgi:hypothetical protein
MDLLSKQPSLSAIMVERPVKAILLYMATTDSRDQVVLDKNYTIGTVLQTTNLNNVAIQLSGTINLSPRAYFLSELKNLI